MVTNLAELNDSSAEASAEGQDFLEKQTQTKLI